MHYVIHIRKPIWTGRLIHKLKSKRIEVNADSMREAIQYVISNFPDFEISMIWPG